MASSAGSPRGIDPQEIVVIGAGAAGLSAGQGLRDRGYEGVLTIVGEEPETPYDRPPLTKQILSGEWDVRDAQLMTDRDLDGLQARLMLGQRATAMDTARREIVTSTGEVLPYDAAIV